MKREQLLFYALKYKGDWNRIAKAVVNSEKWSVILTEKNFSYITILDKEYPLQLLRLQSPPWVIFYKGNIHLLQRQGVAVIGARNCNQEGILNCKKIVHILKNKHTIISGLAKGIDAVAHVSALNNSTIGVIGCGIDFIYPKENQYLYRIMEEKHLILSEYPNDVKPLAKHFPFRNRIIAGLSNAIIVVQSKKRSGTMITVNLALDLGIPIYCIPYAYEDVFGEGCNYLISQGANLILNEKDVLEI